MLEQELKRHEEELASSRTGHRTVGGGNGCLYHRNFKFGKLSVFFALGEKLFLARKSAIVFGTKKKVSTKASIPTSLRCKKARTVASKKAPYCVHVIHVRTCSRTRKRTRTAYLFPVFY